MKNQRNLFFGILSAALILAAVPALAERPWIEYRSEKFGFSMQVPKGTTLKGKDWKTGWGGVHANYLGVRIWGLAHLDKKHTPEEIETFGVLVTGIPKKHWTQVDEGKGQNGFEWHKVARADLGKQVMFGLYGVGPKGSYLIVLKTTQKSFEKDKEAYLRWYKSIQAF